jgi:hypothetical protein
MPEEEGVVAEGGGVLRVRLERPPVHLLRPRPHRATPRHATPRRAAPCHPPRPAPLSSVDPTLPNTREAYTCSRHARSVSPAPRCLSCPRVPHPAPHKPQPRPGHRPSHGPSHDPLHDPHGPLHDPQDPLHDPHDPLHDPHDPLQPVRPSCMAGGAHMRRSQGRPISGGPPLQGHCGPLWYAAGSHGGGGGGGI